MVEGTLEHPAGFLELGFFKYLKPHVSGNFYATAYCGPRATATPQPSTSGASQKERMEQNEVVIVFSLRWMSGVEHSREVDHLTFKVF